MYNFSGNIPGNEIEKGDLLVDYLRPIPLSGTGYHRYAFVLYKQDKKLDFSSYKKDQPWWDDMDIFIDVKSSVIR